jgi:ABC-type uncharacterized transport system permease subunit
VINAPNSMPSGDSPHTAQQYYLYLQGHHQNDGRVVTWTVDWLSIAWLWGFLVALILAILLWIWQYRSTRQRLYPIDQWGGYTSELAGPATGFFLLLVALLTGFAVAMIVGHIVYGQKF